MVVKIKSRLIKSYPSEHIFVVKKNKKELNNGFRRKLRDYHSDQVGNILFGGLSLLFFAEYLICRLNNYANLN